MPARGANSPSEEEWNTQKPRLKKLWLDDNKPLPGLTGVMKTMSTEHNFVATKYQYEKHFRDWKWSKNQKREDWERLRALVQQRSREGKDTDVRVNGIPQSRNKIRRELSRYGRAVSQRLPISSIQDLPKNITIRSPIVDETDSLIIDLPFGELESLLRLQNNFPDYQSLVWPNSAPSPSSFHPRQIAYDDTESEDWYDGGELSSIEEVESLMQQPSMDAIATQDALDIRRISSSVSTALKSVVPKLIADEKLLPSSRFLASNDPVFKSPLHRQILFSVANNFAGLSAFPVGDIMFILQRETTEKLYQMVRSARGPASRAIIQNIFKAAIEIGDARIVDLLVRENTADIRVNEQFLVAGGVRYTLIERATALRHEAVVRNLIRHGADVNKTGCCENLLHVNKTGSSEHFLHGALDHAVCTIRNNTMNLDIHDQLCLMLLEAGGDLSWRAMEVLIEAEQGGFVELIFSKMAQEKAANWYPADMMNTLYLVIKHLDSQRAL